MPSGPARWIVGLGLALATTGLPGCRAEPVRAQAELLGTVCVITVYDSVPDQVLQGALDVVRDVHRKMSRQEPDSEVTRINQAAGLASVPVSEETFEVVRKGLEYGKLTGGAFDVTVGPLVSLWGIGTPEARVPSAEEIRAALDLVDYREVVLDPDVWSVYLRRKGMALDLGGIAKGYAADRAAAYLLEHGVHRAILDFGGNIYTLGTPRDRAVWRIGIQDPHGTRGTPMGIVEVGSTSVVTSGAYERYFESGGVRYHHILDTTTGYPARGVLSTTVVCRSSTDADALSTSLFVLGPERGLELARSLPGVEAMVITEDGKVHATQGLAAILRITQTAYRLSPS